MNLEDLKDQLQERFGEYWEKIQESDTFILLKERYDSLSPLVQKVVIGFIAFLFLFFVYSIPSDYVTSSEEQEEYFVQNRDAIRDMFEVTREVQTTQKAPNPPNIEMLKSKVKSYLNTERVAPELFKGTKPATAPASPPLVGTKVKQEGIEIVVNQLNLKQLTGLGENLSAISPVTKLIDVSITANKKNNHYFNVKYVLANFSWQDPAPIANKLSFKKNKKGKNKK